MAAAKQHAQVILEITDIKLTVLESFPVQLRATIIGTVPSAGWSRPDLVPYTYIQEPPDGIYDYVFVAVPPKEVASQVITPIGMRSFSLPFGACGIRVHASLNSIEAVAPGACDPCTETQAAAAGDVSSAR